MGGQALAHCTRRYQADEYYPIERRLLDQIASIFPKSGVSPIITYSAKESFGDMDIVLESDKLPSNWVDVTIAAFNLSKDEWKKNSNVLSFKFEEIQVDLITTPSEIFQSSIDYFSYSDLNNLVGRVAKKLGFKLGHEGLSLIIRPKGNDHEHIIEEILLTRDITIAYDILEINLPYKFHDGFETLEEMFEWVASSKYFNPDIFLLHNRNATSRVRDKKRKTYNSFLKWCGENNDTLTHFEFESNDERGGYTLVEPYYSEIICKYFPEVEDKVNSAIAKYELNKEFKKYFNGTLIQDLFGLEGKELGAFMAHIKPIFSDKQYFIDNNHLIIPILEAIYKLSKNSNF